ncbi:MAG: hypothetical protein U9R37_05035 [Campylobacterota bacterium]|nr:hypothetical protein [Campylobacterota bacterium]
MSDMSFKQAKSLVEQLELTEVTLNKTLSQLEKASDNFDSSLSKQESIIKHIPKNDEKLTIMKIIVALNIGFVIGIVVSKYLI